MPDRIAGYARICGKCGKRTEGYNQCLEEYNFEIDGWDGGIDWFGHKEEYCKVKEETVNMKKEALIIVDMSNDFVADNGSLTAGKPAQEIVSYIVEQANKFLSEDNVVVVTMDAHQPNDSHFELWPPHNIVTTKGQQLYGELYDWYQNNAKNKNVIYTPKTNYNAFFKTDLAAILKHLEVEKVHVVGVCTDICDFLTVAGADAEGFKTAIHKRGAATFTELGETMINHMKLCFHTEIIE